MLFPAGDSFRLLKDKKLRVPVAEAANPVAERMVPVVERRGKFPLPERMVPVAEGRIPEAEENYLIVYIKLRNGFLPIVFGELTPQMSRTH